MKEILPPSNQQNLLSVVNNFLDAIKHEDGIISTIDGLRSVVPSVADCYKQSTGNAIQVDLIFSLLTECLEEISGLQEEPLEGKVVVFHYSISTFLAERNANLHSTLSYHICCLRGKPSEVKTWILLL